MACFDAVPQPARVGQAPRCQCHETVAWTLRDKIRTCRIAEPLPDQQKNPAGLPLLSPGDLPGVPFYCASTFNLCCSVAVIYVYQRKLHAVNRGRCFSYTLPDAFLDVSMVSTIRLINQLPFPVSDEFTPALLATPTCPAVVLTKAEALAKAADF